MERCYSVLVFVLFSFLEQIPPKLLNLYQDLTRLQAVFATSPIHTTTKLSHRRAYDDRYLEERISY